MNGRRSISSRRNAGWVLLEMIAAMSVVGILATSLVLLEFRHHIAMGKLADLRTSVHQAEAELLQLQTGATAGQDKIHLTILKDESPLPNCAWVEVKCAVGDQSQSVVGLVPVSRLPKFLEAPR